MNDPPYQVAPETRRVMDITGPENTMILLPAPGDEVTACGGLVAQACARGRPPFVVILGDGTEDGDGAVARARERASRAACRRLGLPDDRLLFVGLRQGAFPAAGTPLFTALLAAMAQVSWRRDCNVLLAPHATPDGPDGADAAMAWQLAAALAGEIGVALLARIRPGALPLTPARPIWRLESRRGDGRDAAADDFPPDGEEHYARLG